MLATLLENCGAKVVKNLVPELVEGPILSQSSGFAPSLH